MLFSDRLAKRLSQAIVVTAVSFGLYHLIILFGPGYSPIERLLVFGLLMAEIFFAVSATGYARWVIKSKDYQALSSRMTTPMSTSSVACFIPICDEPVDVVEETLASVTAMRYVNKTVYLLDDSRKKHNARANHKLAKIYGAEWVRRPGSRYFKAGNLNHSVKLIKEKYFAVFDADQRPMPSFLADLVPILDERSKLALIQTPQAYRNVNVPITLAASLQNGLFYEYIAEAKDVSQAMFCCGTNFLARTRAFKSIGGFDLDSLTEDFATSLKLHAAGWETQFYNTEYVTGLGPETLNAYFKQYTRWATGTLQVLVAGIKMFFTNRQAMTKDQWIEYGLSCSYYLSGPVNFYLLLLPGAFSFLNARLANVNSYAYLSLLMLNMIVFWSFFLLTSARRGYPLKQLILVCARLEMCKFYAYTRATISVLWGISPRFQVTEKGAGRKLPWINLLVPLSVLALNLATVVYGLALLSMDMSWSFAANTFFAGYNVWMLSAILQFNDSGSRAHFKARSEPLIKLYEAPRKEAVG